MVNTMCLSKYLAQELERRGHSDPTGGSASIMEYQHYPWDKCIEDMTKKYGDKDKAEKICSDIGRASSMKNNMNK